MSQTAISPRARLRIGTAALLAITAMLVAGCQQQAPEKAADTRVAAPAPAPVVAPPEPVLTRALGRADILAAARQAAAEFAEGMAPLGPDPLVGRTFMVRIPFGCAGPTPPAVPGAQTAGLSRWTPGPEGKTIQIGLEPADWSTAAIFAAPEAAERWEAVEGFWIPRPWLASDTCPRIVVDPMATALPVSRQTVGLAAVFERGGSRIGRRDGRAYSFTVRGTDAGPPVAPGDGYRLLLAGRIAAFPDGRAFACSADGPDQQPLCVVAVQLDRVAFKAGGEMLTEWRPS